MGQAISMPVHDLADRRAGRPPRRRGRGRPRGRGPRHRDRASARSRASRSRTSSPPTRRPSSRSTGAARATRSLQRLERAERAGAVGLIVTLDWSFSHGRDWGSPSIPEQIDLQDDAAARPRGRCAARAGSRRGPGPAQPPDLDRAEHGAAGRAAARRSSAPTASGCRPRRRRGRTSPGCAQQWDGPVHAEGRHARRRRQARGRHRRDRDLGVEPRRQQPRRHARVDPRRCPPSSTPSATEVEVVLDGGIRRGGDVVKAVALGARAVMIGRAYLWGLAANGQAGVENVLDILRGGIDSALARPRARLDRRAAPRRRRGARRLRPPPRRTDRVLARARLDAATWPDVAEAAADSLLACPLGSTEQHGPHLPLATDTDIAVAVADAARGAARTTSSSRPPLPYGSSGEHAGFAGTLSIGAAALEQVVVELVRAPTRSPASCSCPPTAATPSRCTAPWPRCSGEGRDVLAWSPAIRGGDAHAGRTETSMMLALRPRARARSDAAEAGDTDRSPSCCRTLRAGRRRAVSPNGVLGDPTGAIGRRGRPRCSRPRSAWTTLATGATRERQSMDRGGRRHRRGPRHRRGDGAPAGRRRLARSCSSTAAPTTPRSPTRWPRRPSSTPSSRAAAAPTRALARGRRRARPGGARRRGRASPSSASAGSTPPSPPPAASPAAPGVGDRPTTIWATMLGVNLEGVWRLGPRRGARAAASVRHRGTAASSPSRPGRDASASRCWPPTRRQARRERLRPQPRRRARAPASRPTPWRPARRRPRCSRASAAVYGLPDAERAHRSTTCSTGRSSPTRSPRCVAWLCGPDERGVTGAVLPVDAGATSQ